MLVIISFLVFHSTLPFRKYTSVHKHMHACVQLVFLFVRPVSEQIHRRYLYVYGFRYGCVVMGMGMEVRVQVWV